jgi:hypothetical protein
MASSNLSTDITLPFLLSYRSNLTPILHEAKLELHPFSQNWLIVPKFGT